MNQSAPRPVVWMLFVALSSFAIAREASAAPSDSPSMQVALNLTLEGAVRMALTDHPAISIASANERIARTRLVEARSAWVPVVEASESFTRGNNPVFVFGSLLEQGRFAPANFDPLFLNNPPSLDNYRTALSVRYPLFDQFRRMGATREASYGVSIASAGSNATEQSVRLQVFRAFYGALLAAEQRRVADQAVKSAAADVKRIRDRVEVGLLVQSDLLAAQVQLAMFQQRQVSAEGELAIARRALSNAVGNPHQKIEPVGSLAPMDLPLGDLEELLASGVEARADVRSSRLEEQIASSRVRTARGDALPRVDGFANWGASGESISSHNSDHTIGLVATWRLPDATVWAQRRRAAEEENQAEARRRQTTDAAELEIVSAWQHARAAEARQAIGTVSIAQAEEALRIVRDRYEQGLTSITEVLRAQTSQVEASVLHLSALHDYYVSYAELLQATGRLASVQPFIPSPHPGESSR